jgi:hypothetical protein
VVIRLDSRERVDVLSRLLAHNVDHVIDRDDADQLVLFVHYGECEQVIGGDHSRDLFLVGVCRHLDNVADHDLAQRGRRGIQKQLPQAHHAQQVVAQIDDVEVEGHLELFRAALERGDGLRDRHVFVERKIVGRHYAPRRLVGESE